MALFYFRMEEINIKVAKIVEICKKLQKSRKYAEMVRKEPENNAESTISE